MKNKIFWRPFLIVAGAVVLLAAAARFIPAFETALLPIKNMDVIKSLADTFQTGKKDSLAVMAKTMHMDSALEPLQSFSVKLAAQLKGKKENIRIAYFGDSIIEGDLITGKLREQFQQNYGGNGVGLVPITSIVNEFRRTVGHKFSKNWETLSFINRGSGAALGMMGHTFIPRNYYYAESVIEKDTPQIVSDTLAADTLITEPTPKEQKKETKRYYVDGPSWVEYYGVQYPGGASSFSNIRLFYSHASGSSSISVSYDGGPRKNINLQSGQSVHILNLSSGSAVKRIRLDFNPLDPIHVYGVSFDNPQGVYVDNLSMRSFSGLHMSSIPKDYLASFQSALGYDLVVLQYGLNVSNPNTRDYTYYKKGMLASVRHLQAALPGVPILILSAHDRSTKQNGSFQTSPDIPILVKAQGDLAKETNSAFWNMFEAMGGLNSMVEYVKAKPALANLDFTHFTLAGANKLGGMLYKLLTTGESN